MSLAPGSYVGVYEILAPVGSGGMAEVYRARDPKLRRQVAIKVLPPALAQDPDRLSRFERVAQAVEALSHPNILAIHDYGRDGGIAYVVMELLDGRSLRDVLDAGRLPRWKAMNCAAQIAKGLQAAHAQGIVHGDLKPENVFVSAANQAKIVDFGLADVGAVMGSLEYMAPEQVRGESSDHRADIFAFGRVLDEMLCGKRALAGASSGDAMHAVLSSAPRDLTTLSSVSGPLLRLVTRCLESSPAARFQSTSELVIALDEAAAPRPPETRSATPIARSSRWFARWF
jgi:serine/threonine protein kinase